MLKIITKKGRREAIQMNEPLKLILSKYTSYDKSVCYLGTAFCTQLTYIF
jgi:hypothetical protein